MKDILEIILYIIAGLGGIAGIVLLIIMTLQVVVSAKEERTWHAMRDGSNATRSITRRA